MSRITHFKGTPVHHETKSIKDWIQILFLTTLPNENACVYVKRL